MVAAFPFVFGLTRVGAETIDSWNPDNVVADLPDFPLVDPSHTPGVTYDSTLFTNTDRVGTSGAVIWKEGPVVAPGPQLLTDSPNPGNNCIIARGTNRAVPGAIPKARTDELQSAKRVNLDARAAGTGIITPDAITLSDGKPLDMVFNISAADATDRAYRVFKKFINNTIERTDGFVVALGFGAGGALQPSITGDGLRFSPRQQGQTPKIPVFDPLPSFSAPLERVYGDQAARSEVGCGGRCGRGWLSGQRPSVPDDQGDAG